MNRSPVRGPTIVVGLLSGVRVYYGGALLRLAVTVRLNSPGLHYSRFVSESDQAVVHYSMGALASAAWIGEGSGYFVDLALSDGTALR